MFIADGPEPVEDEEVLYRRVPVSKNWYTPGVPLLLSPEAFDPRSDEVDGISLYRAKHKALEAVAQGKSKSGYYVACVRAGDLRAAGITLRPDSDPSDPGHVTVPDLNATNRDTDRALELKVTLAIAFGRDVRGPFLPTATPPP